MRRPCTLPLVSLSLSLACAAGREAPRDPEPAPTLPSTSVAQHETPVVADPPPGPPVPWKPRTAIAVGELQAGDPALHQELLTLRPDRRVGDEWFFARPEVDDPRAAAVLLGRLLNGDDPVGIRLAVGDALPATGGDWQEGAGTQGRLVRMLADDDPAVRLQVLIALERIDPGSPSSSGSRAIGSSGRSPSSRSACCEIGRRSPSPRARARAATPARRKPRPGPADGAKNTTARDLPARPPAAG